MRTFKQGKKKRLLSNKLMYYYFVEYYGLSNSINIVRDRIKNVTGIVEVVNPCFIRQTIKAYSEMPDEMISLYEDLGYDNELETRIRYCTSKDNTLVSIGGVETFQVAGQKFFLRMREVSDEVPLDLDLVVASGDFDLDNV